MSGFPLMGLTNIQVLREPISLCPALVQKGLTKMFRHPKLSLLFIMAAWTLKFLKIKDKNLFFFKLKMALAHSILKILRSIFFLQTTPS